MVPYARLVFVPLPQPHSPFVPLVNQKSWAASPSEPQPTVPQSALWDKVGSIQAFGDPRIWIQIYEFVQDSEDAGMNRVQSRSVPVSKIGTVPKWSSRGVLL